MPQQFDVCPRLRYTEAQSENIGLVSLIYFLGAFWLTFGGTLVPAFNAFGAYVTDPKVAATHMGQPGNPAGLQTPAFNASFAFFLVFMGLFPSFLPQSPLLSKERKDTKARDTTRPRLPRLPHLLPPHQHRLLRHLPLPRLRLRLPLGRILESRARVRKSDEPDGAEEGATAHRCTSAPSLPIFNGEK